MFSQFEWILANKLVALLKSDFILILEYVRKTTVASFEDFSLPFYDIIAVTHRHAKERVSSMASPILLRKVYSQVGSP
jgi:hypothetical protein